MVIQKYRSIDLKYMNCIISLFLTFISLILIKSEKNIKKIQKQHEKRDKNIMS